MYIWFSSWLAVKNWKDILPSSQDSRFNRIFFVENLFNEMIKYGCKPNCTIHNIFLLNGHGIACNTENICQLFQKMVDQGICSDMKSYTVFIDTLRTAWRLNDGLCYFWQLKGIWTWANLITHLFQLVRRKNKTVQQELTNNNWIRTLRGKITTAHPSGSVFRMPIYSWMKKIKLLGNGLRMDNKHTKYNSWAPTEDTEQATLYLASAGRK